MNNELVVIVSTSPAIPDSDVLEAWLSAKNRNTASAYRHDIEDFARFVGAASPGIAVDGLLALARGDANRVVIAYQAHLADRGLSSATIARRICAICSMVRTARRIGRVGWTLDVDVPKIVPLRDTAGPGHDGWLKMRSTVKAQTTTAEGKRDFALVSLLHDSGLRRAECVHLDLCHVELDRSRVSILGKGCTDRQWVTISPQACEALAEWITARGLHDGPLFCRMDRAAFGVGRLTGESVNRLVNRLGVKSGLTRKVRAHGLRHQAITRVLDLTNGNIRKAQAFSRHVDPKMLMKYDDNRLDLAGELAAMLGADD